jgi:hypothetical protein
MIQFKLKFSKNTLLKHGYSLNNNIISFTLNNGHLLKLEIDSINNMEVKKIIVNKQSNDKKGVAQ